MNRICRLELTADIVCAYIRTNDVAPNKLPDLILTVQESLLELSKPKQQADTSKTRKPKINTRDSISDAALTCLECGRSFKSLKRHLSIKHDLKANMYRSKWKLPADYPMMAPAYARKRAMMVKIGSLMSEETLIE